RNKAALVMASVIGVALLLAVGSLGWVGRDREAGRVRTAGEVNQFLQQAESLYADNKLPEAVAEVPKARGGLESGHGEAGRGRAEGWGRSRRRAGCWNPAAAMRTWSGGCGSGSPTSTRPRSWKRSGWSPRQSATGCIPTTPGYSGTTASTWTRCRTRK